ncbi:hypothetical protein B0H10DRAFT_2050992 [Mycena sp. CBHHK59/15]|nr:hypothetical protein B0H10DRAFT_2050992 [Mycena sp. CBHHK59/15]
MFSLIRRFSGSVIPRADRPWEEDPTSNAPHVGRKRRMADEDRDDDDEEQQSRLKKVRGATTESKAESQPTVRETSSTPLPQAKETEGVKEVTKGVKEVELEEKPQTLPESVPLPEAVAGELDGESSSTASTPPPAGEPLEEDATIAAETTPGMEVVSGEVVSDSAEATNKEESAEATSDAVEVAAAPVEAEPVPVEARPIKKLRAKPKSTAEPVAPVES